MSEVSKRRRIWGWFFFDWASQPYNTLLLTFIFGPYFAAVVTEYFMSSGMTEQAADAQAQSIWSLGLTISGLFIAFSAPFLGAMADASGRRMPWIVLFSVLYVVGSFLLWFMYPDGSTMWLALIFFGIGLVGMEFATIFTNALLPDLGTQEEIGKISGSGFGFGYAGGIVALFIMLLLFAEDETGKTLIGISPLFGLDAEMREGTRFVGPFSALWYAVFMVFFFRWVKEPKAHAHQQISVGAALSMLVTTLKSLRHRTSLAAFLASSLFYRDALNGLYTFGGVYALLVLDWTTPQVGVFGIIGGIAAAVFAWLGGKLDSAIGPKPVIVTSIAILVVVCAIIVSMSRESFFGFELAENSTLPDLVFYICGAAIGAAGGTVQAASRSMMVRHVDAEHAAEAFGLYALSGKATAFLAPALIGAFTYLTGNARLGVAPLIGLFVIGLFLLIWVKANPKSGGATQHL